MKHDFFGISTESIWFINFQLIFYGLYLNTERARRCRAHGQPVDELATNEAIFLQVIVSMWKIEAHWNSRHGIIR